MKHPHYTNNPPVRPLSNLAKLNRKGGQATAKKLTAAQRKASASKAAKARWTKRIKT
jgi:hypothetical protein